MAPGADLRHIHILRFGIRAALGEKAGRIPGKRRSFLRGATCDSGFSALLRLYGDGHKSKMPRNCTIDYKVELISKYVRWELLGYKKGQRLREEDKKAHEMHMGFSAEESRRCKESPNPMFVNKFPLVEMGLTRADNFAYIKDVWGLETKASACSFCPFHKNYFFKFLRENEPEQYAHVVGVDELLRDKNPKPPMDSDLFISRSRKRLMDLTDCGMQIWNGF